MEGAGIGKTRDVIIPALTGFAGLCLGFAAGAMMMLNIILDKAARVFNQVLSDPKIMQKIAEYLLR